jgi:CAP-Gly domain-containing linker protein 1
MQTVDDRTSEMETLRKKVNREVSLSNGILESKGLSPKSESSTNREEVAGLKYVAHYL